MLHVCACTHPPVCTLSGEHQLIRNEGLARICKTGSEEGRCGVMMSFIQ